MRARRLLLASVLAAAVPFAGCTLPNATRLGADAADPSVRWDGVRYVLQTTNNAYGNVPTWTSPDLGTWKFSGDALPKLPAWAQPGWTWAPTSIRRNDGRWFLYFSAAVRGRTTANGQPLKCIGVASAPTAAGPYTVVQGRDQSPLLCDSANGGDIDPSAFRQDATGNVYLISKVDGNSMARPTRIESRRLTADLSSFASPATVLLSSTIGTWEAQVIEGPDLASVSNRLRLIYSGGDFATSAYGEGQAACASPSQVCVRNGRLLDSGLYGSGAGGASTFRGANGAMLLAWHAYTTSGSSQRSLLLGTLTASSSGVLSVSGSPVPAAAAHTTPAQRAAGAPDTTELTVPANQPVTVPNAHTR